MTTVRRITADEFPALRAVRIAALTDSPAAFGSTLERELAFTDDMWRERASASSAGDARLTLLAWERDEVVGVIGAFRTAAEAPVVELVSMWTRPEVRRSGVAVALVQGVVDWAQSLADVARVELWVVRGNEPAQRLYERMGFHVTDDVQPSPNDPCAQEIRMVLPLA